MIHPTDLVSPADLQKVANLQVLARRVVEGFCAGLHRSPHKGFSVDFKQHRQYVPGDDVRYLDWKVFGKSDRFFIREYEAETNLRATILLDASGSMAYGGAFQAGTGPGGTVQGGTGQGGTGQGGTGQGGTGQGGVGQGGVGQGGVGAAAEGSSDASIPKLDYAVRLAVCLSYLMLQQQDAVGLVTFDTKVLRYIPPRATPRHLSVLIEEAGRRKPGGETGLAPALREIFQKIHRRGLIVVLSDLFDDVTDVLRALAQFRHAGHEIIVFQLWHRDELEFPFTHWTRFECLEVGGLSHRLDPAHVRSAYLQKLAEYRDALTKGCRRHRIDLVPMVTDQPYADALARYLALRMRRT